ncbi:unnamed protein product [Arabidopsis lyrata]|nr:unnamed protein product [Arabidopsis lyrata]
MHKSNREEITGDSILPHRQAGRFFTSIVQTWHRGALGYKARNK